MQTAANLANPLVDALVRHAERRTGSRMLAYEAVGRMIGTTASWVRKFVGNQPVRLDADTFLRIRASYQANCDRWDAQADEDRAAFFALGGGRRCNGSGHERAPGCGGRRASYARPASLCRGGSAGGSGRAVTDAAQSMR
ncbi:hypothetical protein [Methylobacterium sp. R2-1]|uniref:hypothetical protein n=1 Tax=Methylobacterium sp. R2-1 TaxID=2587064 RepID=UPI00185D4D38|nr:hypothetical protein [Methylobacterium sp. R2-1]MBB2965033.1 hypothetical protein [Methylobacterium sp. R2-1]